jgi:hypothetical protein
MTERRTEVGACGNYCRGCLDFRALAENSDALRTEAASNIKQELNREIPLEQVGCEGCWGSIHNAWTASLDCKVRQCVEAKGFATCAECNDFACPMYLDQFAEGSDYVRNIRAIKRDGLDKWIAQQTNALDA